MLHAAATPPLSPIGTQNLQNAMDNPEYVFRFLDTYFGLPSAGLPTTSNNSFQRFVVWPSQPVGKRLRYRVIIVANRYAQQPSPGRS